MFGRASWSTARPDTASSDQIDKKEDRGFSYLKRDLVRLLGILCYENRAVQDRMRNCHGIPVVMNMCVTDERNPCTYLSTTFLMRAILTPISIPNGFLSTSGIHHENFSYLMHINRSDLREHALFTLRNLLHNNLENQAVVDGIKPVGTWDENGVLRDVLGAQK